MRVSKVKDILNKDVFYFTKCYEIIEYCLKHSINGRFI